MVVEWIEIIQSIGLPAAMILWFMIRTEKVINSNTYALTKFRIIVENCKKK